METMSIIWIILGTGVFGGIINYFRNVFDTKIQYTQMVKPLLLGLAASALVPLFLNTISSNLLKTHEELPVNYFVFMGFCLIAAIFSGEFIDSIGKKVLTQIGAVRQEIEEINTEDETQEVRAFERNEEISENQKKILDAFVHSKFTYRSISGLADQTDLDKGTVKQELVNLQKEGLTEVTDRQKGLRWKITTDGFRK